MGIGLWARGRIYDFIKILIDLEMDNNVAHIMLNLTLKSGWVVKEKPERDPNQSGFNFSVGYIVEKDGETCFMKVFDLAGFLAIATVNGIIIFL